MWGSKLAEHKINSITTEEPPKNEVKCAPELPGAQWPMRNLLMCSILLLMLFKATDSLCSLVGLPVLSQHAPDGPHSSCSWVFWCSMMLMMLISVVCFSLINEDWGWSQWQKEADHKDVWLVCIVVFVGLLHDAWCMIHNAWNMALSNKNDQGAVSCSSLTRILTRTAGGTHTSSISTTAATARFKKDA